MTPRTWKLWLDDYRDPAIFAPDDDDTDFIWCHDCQQAMYYTRMWGPPDFMALDHDLAVPLSNHASGSLRTEDVFKYLRWLERAYPESCPRYRIHSENPVGRNNIVSFMGSWRKSLTPEVGRDE